MTTDKVEKATVKAERTRHATLIGYRSFQFALRNRLSRYVSY